MVTGLILGGMNHRNIRTFHSFCEERRQSASLRLKFAQKHVEAGVVSHVPCLFCLFFFFFKFFGSLSEQLPLSPTLSLHLDPLLSPVPIPLPSPHFPAVRRPSSVSPFQRENTF